MHWRLCFHPKRSSRIGLVNLKIQDSQDELKLASTNGSNIQQRNHSPNTIERDINLLLRLMHQLITHHSH